MERAAHSVDHRFSLYFTLFVILLVVSHFGLVGIIWVLITPVPGHCILVNVKNKETKIRASDQIRQESVCFSKEATVKSLNFRTPKKLCCNLPKIQTKKPNLSVFCQNDANGIANSEDPDQTAPRGSGSALFAQNYLSENLGSLR